MKELIAPWLPCAGICLVNTYVIIQLAKKLYKITINREQKAALPIVSGIIYQLAVHYKHFYGDVWSTIIILGQGAIIGAVVSSMYEILIRRFLKIIHKEKD